jgi:hypothetical protein
MSARQRRNLRPRDELGRPLPYGSDGFTPPSWVKPRNATEAIQLAQRLLDDGLPFYAHEVLEDEWKAAPGADRQLWRGLAQLTVGMTHCARGNRAGALSLMRRGAAAIEPYRASPPHGVDVTGLLAWANELTASLAGNVQPGLCTRVPQLLAV